MSWWWGKPVENIRWNLYSGIILLASVLFHWIQGRTAKSSSRLTSWILVVGILIFLNATVVHFVLAPNIEVSDRRYWLLVKFVVLFLLIVYSARSRFDLRIILLSIIIGAAYIGYETSWNQRGNIKGNRLESIGASSASTANDLANLMVTILPMTGAFFLAGNKWERAAMVVSAPLILNVILLCNSRGAFLGCFAVCITILFNTPPQIRIKIIKLLCLGFIALWILLGDPKILQRFETTFNSAEMRDHSASSRLDYWKAGLMVIADHPIGSGGDGFSRVHGPKYIKYVDGEDFQRRSVHNGFINEACEWGLQGFVLRLLFLIGPLFLLRNSAKIYSKHHDHFATVLSVTMMASIIGFSVQSTFGDFLDNEWSYWIVAISILVHCSHCGISNDRNRRSYTNNISFQSCETRNNFEREIYFPTK